MFSKKGGEIYKSRRTQGLNKGHLFTHNTQKKKKERRERERGNLILLLEQGKRVRDREGGGRVCVN